MVPDFPRGAPLDPVCQNLIHCTALVVYQERVHLRPQSNELCDRIAIRLVLEFADHFLVRGMEEWTRLVERSEVEVLPLGEVLLVDGGLVHPVHERVDAWEEHLRCRVLLHEVVVV